MKSNSYNVLFGLKTLKSILDAFLSSFLVLYFLQVSNSNILPLGIYKLVSMITVYIVIFLLKDICKTNKRLSLLRIGIFLNLLYFCSIIILKEKIVDYIYLIGILYGLEEGFYYSVYNMIESDGVSNKDRSRFLGTTHALNNILSIILPVAFGYIIKNYGFINSLIIFIIMILFHLFLSSIYKDTNIPKSQKADLKGFYKIFKSNKKLKLIFKNNIFNGLTYSEGPLTSIITIYIIKVFSDSFSLGIFTSVFCIISAFVGLLFAKIINPKYYNSFIIISTFFTIVSLVFMIINCNALSIIIFNLFQRISKSLTNLVNEKNLYNIANDDILKREYKVEYFLLHETGLLIGRVIGNSLFIIMSFTSNNIVLYIFIVFLIIWTYYSIKIQTEEKNSK